MFERLHCCEEADLQATAFVSPDDMERAPQPWREAAPSSAPGGLSLALICAEPGTSASVPWLLRN